MLFKNLMLLGTAALLASPVFGASYYGGLEDWTHLDYDYNDVVFSLSSSNLKLNSAAQWFNQPVLGTSGSPFWNHSSLDGPNDNIGYCIYGGGSCHGGSALFAGSQYLASNATGSANDVTFTASGSVQLNVILQNTAAKDILGWYSVSDPSTVTWLNSSASDGLFSFNPGGAFGLVARTQGSDPNQGFTYYSQTGFGSADSVSHFAFFGDSPVATAPEPASLALMLSGLLAAAGAICRRKRSS